jgi:hypothetical protein
MRRGERGYLLPLSFAVEIFVANWLRNGAVVGVGFLLALGFLISRLLRFCPLAMAWVFLGCGAAAGSPESGTARAEKQAAE